MHSDQPTVPNLPRYDASNSSGAGEPDELPSWPVVGERMQRARGVHRSRGKDAGTLALGMSLGANVVLLFGLLLLLLLGHASFFAPGGSSAPAGPEVATTSLALSSPTATSSATAGSGGWLRVAPSSVQLGCAGGQQNQFVILENTGPEKVQWRAALAAPSDQPSVTVSPNQGELDAGTSMPLQIQNMTHASAQQGGASQQGVIRFDPNTSDAGPAPSLSFTAMGCR